MKQETRDLGDLGDSGRHVLTTSGPDIDGTCEQVQMSDSWGEEMTEDRKQINEN